MRLIGQDGEQLGIKALPEALSIARGADLDLVEVAPSAAPPVCRIMDYSKYKFEAQQKAKESRKKATNVVVKEMKYRPKIGVGDFTTKTKKVEQFLGEGHKVKLTIMFRGREMQHPELGRRILDRVAEEVVHVGKVEVMPKQDGRNMTMVLGPDKKAQAAAAKSSDDEAAETAPEGSVDVVAEHVAEAPEAVNESTASEPPAETASESPVEAVSEPEPAAETPAESPA